MATIQELVNSVDALDASVQAQTSQAATSKIALDDAVSEFSATTSKLDTELNNVDNTSDADKEVSTAQALAIGQKVNTSDLATVNGQSLNTGEALVIERSATSLVFMEYEDRGDLKTIAIQPIVDDSVQVEGIGLFKFHTTQLEPIDDETCFNHQNGGQWLLMNPHYDLSCAYDLFETAVIFDFLEDTSQHLEEATHTHINY